MKVLYFISEDWYFLSHRKCIAEAALNHGFQVTLVTHVDEKQYEIKKTGINLIPSIIKRSSVNPFHEMRTIIQLICIYKREKPDVVHHVAIKPVIYGTLAASLTGVPNIINALGGLGHIFSSQAFRYRIIGRLFSVILRILFAGKNIRLILQNPDDKNIITNNKIIDEGKIVLIKGSGADLDYFKFSQESKGIPIVMYAGRFLWSKGLGVLVKASEILRKRNVDCKIVLVGRTDPENPASVTTDQIAEWEEKHLIECWGYKEDMYDVIKKSTIVVLPALFREGLPKVLIEAAAVGRPIIASDQPGIREIVRDHWNGVLIEAGDEIGLADAIQELINDPKRRVKMGKNGRILVENEMSQEIVVNQTISLYQGLLE